MKHIELAVKLFERGYPETTVKDALKTCKTLKGAIAWLDKRGYKHRETIGHEEATTKKKRLDKQGRMTHGATLHYSRNRALRVNHKVETCSICYGDTPPTQAVCLRCRHGWYCVHCMKMHADARLVSGDVCVPCPECREPIQEFCLKEFLSHDVIANFHSRSIKQAIACSPNLYSCPTPGCEMCVELEESEDPWMRRCPRCRKGSCLRCGAQPYHKGISCQMYALSMKSKDVIKDELSLRRWMRRTGTKQCPQCRMGVTKEDLQNQSTQLTECHKMLCRHCGTRFCFKCLALLTDTYTCSCSMREHGFINPTTGRLMRHRAIRKAGKTAKAKPFAHSDYSSKASVSKIHASLSHGRAPGKKNNRLT